MDDFIKKMYDPIKKQKETFFSEITGDEECFHYDITWTRRLIAPWGLLVSLEGCGDISIGNKSISAPKGVVLIYKPGFKYQFHTDGMWHYIWFHYPLRDHMLGQLNFTETIPGLGMLSPEEEVWNRSVTDLHEALALEKIHRPGWEALALLLLETVLQRFLYSGYFSSKRSQERLHHAIQLLTGGEEYQMKEIASLCGISLPLLFLLFRKEIGCTPREYREQFFLRQGKKMLLNTDQTLDEIAEACHMCDRYYFSKRFKHLFGISPIAFRKGILKKTEQIPSSGR